MNVSLELYRKLITVRYAEEYIVEHYHEDEMKTPMHMSMGQEQIAVGVLHALGNRARVFSSYRSHAAYLARTGDIDGFFAELYGRVSGPNQGKAGSMHIAAPKLGHMLSSGVVATQIPVAVGMAYAAKLADSCIIPVVFFGDGALNEGAFWESLNVACLLRLPVLFVCEDNGYAVNTPIKARQGFGNIATVVRQFPCTTFVSYTTDVERIYQTTLSAIKCLDSGGSPIFLYAACYRYLEHVGVDEDYDAGYRTYAESEIWRRRDSIKLQRERLLEFIPEKQLTAIEENIRQRIDQAVYAASVAERPGLETFEGNLV